MPVDVLAAPRAASTDRSMTSGGSVVGVDPAQREHLAHPRERRLPRAAQPQEALAHATGSRRARRWRRPAGRARAAGPGTAGSSSTRPVTASGRSAGVEDRDHPAHRVADEHGRLADDLGQEAVEHVDVGLHRRPPSAGLAAAEAGQVDGAARGRAARSSGAKRSQLRCEPPRPCTRTTVGPSSGTAEVDVVDRPAEVDGPALAGRDPLRSCRLGQLSSPSRRVLVVRCHAASSDDADRVPMLPEPAYPRT